MHNAELSKLSGGSVIWGAGGTERRKGMATECAESWGVRPWESVGVRQWGYEINKRNLPIANAEPKGSTE